MSDRYDGLSLPELLDLMHPIVEPATISWMPETVGWWIAAGWVAAVVLVLAWHWRRSSLENRYRREAEVELDAIADASRSDPEVAAQAIAVLLKRTALSAFPREQVAALTGADWAEFLVRTTNRDPTVARDATRLSDAAYRPGADGQQLVEAARRWIRVHRV